MDSRGFMKVSLVFAIYFIGLLEILYFQLDKEEISMMLKVLNSSEEKNIGFHHHCYNKPLISFEKSSPLDIKA